MVTAFASPALSHRSLATARAKIGPGWFTSVMGTGILAIGLRIAPIDSPFLHAAATTIFALDVVLYAAFTLLLAHRFVTVRGAFAATIDDVAVAQLWGAPPMATFTIATGLLLVAPPLVPPGLATSVAQVLFLAGVALSLGSAFVIPFRMFTLHELTPQGAVGSWLLPVVPPIVASVPAALLATSWPVALRSSMLAGAYALLGIGILLSAIVIVVFYSRMLFAKVPENALVTTTWLVVGPLGQSVAGMLALGGAARTVVPAFGGGLYLTGLAYGFLVWGFGIYWLSMAIALTLRASRRSLPFTLGWWAFTFPVGTLMSGSFALFRATNAGVFEIAGYALLALLAAMWTLVSLRSLKLAGSAIAAFV